MAAKVKTGIKKLSKQRQPSKKNGASPAPTTTNAPPAATPKSTTKKNNASEVDTLVSELRDHVEQGRIFDARSVVHKLQTLERRDPATSTKLEPVRHDMEEVLSQSEHVESLLHELHDDDNWTLAKQKSGVTVHYRREADSPIHTVRAVTTFDNFTPKDFVRLCSLFVETELTHKWFPGGVMKPSNLLSWHSKYSKVVQLHISLGLPMISARDSVVLGSGYHMPDKNAFLISTKTILDDTCRYCDIPQPAKGIVRFSTESIFYVEMLKSDSISFKMIGRDDLKLKYMPSSLLNYLSQGHMPFDMMRSIHKTIRNFSGTEWEKKIEERGAYYSEIEDKVLVQLKNWEKEARGNNKCRKENAKIRKDNVQGLQNAQPTEGKFTMTQQNTEKVKMNDVFMASEHDDDKGNRLSLPLVIAPLLAFLLMSAICLVKFPEMLPAIAPISLHRILEVRSMHGLMEVLGKDYSVLAVGALTLLQLIPVAAYISRRKRLNQGEDITDQGQSHVTKKEGKIIKPSNVGDGFDEFLKFVNSDTAPESTQNNAPATPTTVSKEEEEFLRYFHETNNTTAQLGPENESTSKDKPHINMDRNDDMSEITASPRPSPTATTKHINPLHGSLPNQKKKSKSVRSTLNTGLKTMKRAVSRHNVQGK